MISLGLSNIPRETIRAYAATRPLDVYRQIADTIEKRYDDPGTGPNSLENPRTPLDRIFQPEQSYTGKVITPSTALQLAAVYRCVNLIGGALARTPFLPYQRNADGRELARKHYLWPILMQAANPYMTSYRAKRLMQTWTLLSGNSYAEIETNGRGQIVGLWPWRSDRVRSEGAGANKTYTYYLGNGTPVTLPWQMILHIRGLETDGQNGLSPITCARQSMGLYAAAEEYGARYFSNHGRPGGWIKHPGVLGKDGQKNLRETLESLHRGLRGSHRLAILEEGMEYNDVGETPENMQFLQTRQFQAIDIARWYGVPPHMIAELDRATFSNIEHQSIEFVTTCMDDWFVNWEQECMNSLLSEREIQSVELMFLRDRLLQGDSKTRAEAFAAAAAWGGVNPNEWREAQGQNRRKDAGGDQYLRPMNFVVSGSSSPDPIDPEDPDSDGTVVDEPAVTPPPTAAPNPAPTGGKNGKAN